MKRRRLRGQVLHSRRKCLSKDHPSAHYTHPHMGDMAQGIMCRIQTEVSGIQAIMDSIITWIPGPRVQSRVSRSFVSFSESGVEALCRAVFFFGGGAGGGGGVMDLPPRQKELGRSQLANEAPLHPIHRV